MHLTKQPIPPEIRGMIQAGVLPKKTEVYLLDFATVIFSRELREDGKEQLHASISHPFRIPTFEEVKYMRYKLFPNNMKVAMIFPPKEEYVNLEPHTLHLFQMMEGEV